MPSVNAALFAFLTLGINPITNHPLSTPSLIAVLCAGGLAALLLFFNQALTDFFGGLSDWLTHAERAYGQLYDESAVPSAAVLGLAPTQVVTTEATKSVAVGSSLPSFASMVASVRTSTPPTLGLPMLRAYFRRSAVWYRNRIERLRARLQVRVVDESPSQHAHDKAQTSAYTTDIAPELAEVVAIFERLAAQTAEPQEAIIVKPEAPRQPHGAVVLFKRAVAGAERAISVTKRRARQDALRASTKVIKWGVASGHTATSVLQTAARILSKASTSTAHTLYHGVLLFALGVLLAVDRVMRMLIVALHVLGWVITVCYLRLCHGVVLAAVGITFGMISVWRGIVTAVRLLGRLLAAICRISYKLLSLIVSLALLGAGYSLFMFSLLCFMFWEFGEPYARKVDTWVSKSLLGDESAEEMAKVAREMSRTLAQWYREFQNIKHSIYR